MIALLSQKPGLDYVFLLYMFLYGDKNLHTDDFFK